MKWGAHTHNPKGGDPSDVDWAPPFGRRIVLAGYRTLPVPPQSATITFPMFARLMSVGGLDKVRLVLCRPTFPFRTNGVGPLKNVTEVTDWPIEPNYGSVDVVPGRRSSFWLPGTGR